MTRKFLPASLLTGVVSAILFASAPVYAQSSQSQQGSQGENQPLTQNRVRQILEQAGFQNVDIVDAAYLIRAKTKDGNTVTMFINPPSMVEASGQPSNLNPQAPSNRSAQMTGNQSQGEYPASNSQGYPGGAMTYNQGNQGQWGQQGNAGQLGGYPYGQANYGAQGGRYWGGSQFGGQRPLSPQQSQGQQFQGYGSAGQHNGGQE